MNIADIEKLANRKRIIAKAEKFREKVNEQTANIIKLKVAQDTAWDLKEKLENNHECLQQSMVEVQMQHEAISGQYQDELRLRPETLNKLGSTCEICNVLEVLNDKQTQSEEKLFSFINNLQEKVKFLAELKEQISEVFKSSKQLDSELSDARTKLATALRRAPGSGADEIMSLSQLKEPNKKRYIFKNKRLDNNAKKLKPDE